MSVVKQNPKIETYILEDDGTFPNNAVLPLIIYTGAFNLKQGDIASQLGKVLHQNHWGNSWRNGIYTYHHYHSIAHEVLGIYQGEARVQLGGPEGVIITVLAGDAIVIPAGVAHKNLGASDDFACVGAYPPGQDPDMNYGKAGERPKADENIAQVPLPYTDPIYGSDGPLIKHWKK